MSDRSVWHILHSDLNFQPYQIQIVQWLNVRDKEVHLKCHQCMELTCNPNLLLLMTDEAHFHLNELLINKILDTRLTITHMNFMNIPFTTQK